MLHHLFVIMGVLGWLTLIGLIGLALGAIAAVVAVVSEWSMDTLIRKSLYYAWPRAGQWYARSGSNISFAIWLILLSAVEARFLN